MRQVEYFRALCAELNFTKAAKRSGVSQPALTRSIRLLEDEFGGPLFLREAGGTRLSELGAIVKPHIDRIFEQAEYAAEEARNFRDSQKIRLRLGAMCSVAPRDLVLLLRNVRDRHPDIELEILDYNATDLQQKLRTGDVDAAIIGRPVTAPQDPAFHFMTLYRENFLIACADGSQLAALDVVRCVDLDAEAYLNRTHCEMNDTAKGVFNELGVRTRIVYRSNRDDWILSLAAAGMGFAFIPRRSAGYVPLELRPLVEPEFWREVGLMTVRGRPHTPAVGALVHEAMRLNWAVGE